MISALITTYNDALKLKNCLDSVKDFADEIIILDLGSKDQSQNLAKKYNAKIYSHKFVPYVELVRNYAVEKTSYDWILVLDPDESMQEALKDKLKQITKQNKFIAVNIPRKNIFFGRWIKHTNWWPDYHVRFFKRGRVEWSGDIHVYPKVDGDIFQLEADESIAIVHYGYDSIKEFLDRQNRYSSVEAQNLYYEGERFSWGLFFWKPTRDFLVRYIKHAGFLDGFIGFSLTILMMIYKLEVCIKLWEIERQKK